MTEYLSAAQTAKLVREALKREFPGVKFAVQPHRYDGGASVSVRWTGGPGRGSVDKAVRAYAGADFDAATERKADRFAWLAPDGRASRSRVKGARLVRFGADYVFTERISAA
jgi:hypothetical protein